MVLGQGSSSMDIQSPPPLPPTPPPANRDLPAPGAELPGGLLPGAVGGAGLPGAGAAAPGVDRGRGAPAIHPAPPPRHLGQYTTPAPPTGTGCHISLSPNPLQF